MQGLGILERAGIKMEYLNEIGKRAKSAASVMNLLDTQSKNRGLKSAAEFLVRESRQILEANESDVQKAEAGGMKSAMVDRLRLTRERIEGMAEGLLQLIDLKDPIGEVLESIPHPSGMLIEKKRVPMGVIGMIYESRPNVTADAFGLCFKSGNAVILRGGSDALASNTAIVRVIRAALTKEGLPADSIQLLEDVSRETASEFMKLKEYVDLLIPRGGAGLIRTVLENSTVPVIETGTGNCHIYVDESADLAMAVEIIDNAKTQRMGVCNACESLVIHRNIAREAVPAIYARLHEKSVEVRGCEESLHVCAQIVPATEEDYAAEYCDAVISMKIVDSVEEAIAHVNRYTTHHSEAVITENVENAEKFLNEIDAAAVYVNASTRFTDGFEFGFGAEIGISTQKLHVRGPMGLPALTSTKYVIHGSGQVRK